MTDQQDQLKEANIARGWYEVDPQLATFLNLMFGHEDTDLKSNAPITLITSGAVVTGTAISRAAWAEAQADYIQSGAEHLADALRELENETQRDQAETLASEDSDNPGLQRAFVHFSEAMMISGKTQIHANNLRVDLRHVAGWSLGSMTRQEQ